MNDEKEKVSTDSVLSEPQDPQGKKPRKEKKPETPEHVARRHEKEAKEIKKWEKEQARPRGHGYLWYLLFIVTLIYVTDEITSQINAQMQTEIANNLFSASGNSSGGIAQYISYIGYLMMIPALFYKTLADKYGRKLFLVLNALGMSVGMGCMALAYNIPVYILGVAVIGFFTPHDMQCVYIFEVAPKKSRATIYSVSKCVATLGLLFIPLSRALFMNGANGNWHYVYIIPGCIGLVASILGLLFARETDSFMEHRLSYLHKSDEERAIDAQKTRDAQGGVGKAFKFCFSHKQLKWLFIVSLCCTFGIIITQNYSLIMNYGYANSFVASGAAADITEGLSLAAAGPVTAALYLFPVGSALFQLISGPIADKFGRKKDAVVMASCAIASFVLFVVGCKYAWNAYLVGFFAGAAVGSYWMSGDIMGSVMISESCPTNLRTSMLSAQDIFKIIVMVPVMLISSGLLTAFGNNAASIISLCVAVPGMTIALILLFFKIHETKGLDLNKVKGDEWDSKKA